RAPACTSIVSDEVFGFAGFTSRPIVVARGSNSRNNSSLFAAIVLLSQVTPVRFPSGRLKLETKPSLTGSPPVRNTIGIVVVAPLAATGEAVTPVATITATFRRARSAASPGSLSYWLAAQRYSIATLRP